MGNLASIRNHEYINILLDAEKDLRIAESVCQCEYPLRNYSFSMCESWFQIMEGNGFLVDGKFLPIIDIIDKAESACKTRRELIFLLEAVRPNLSRVLDIGEPAYAKAIDAQSDQYLFFTKNGVKVRLNPIVPAIDPSKEKLVEKLIEYRGFSKSRIDEF